MPSVREVVATGTIGQTVNSAPTKFSPEPDTFTITGRRTAGDGTANITVQGSNFSAAAPTNDNVWANLATIDGVASDQAFIGPDLQNAFYWYRIRVTFTAGTTATTIAVRLAG